MGRPLEDYPYPGSGRLLTQTLRGGFWLLLGGVFELLMAGLTAVLAAAGSPWFWLEAVFFLVLGTATAAVGALSWRAHRRFPQANAPPTTARDS